jgi:N-carbamoylputrescine amidase
MKIKVTVCELRNEPKDFAHDWERLTAHVKEEASQVVLLPEMPFSSWFAQSQRFDASVWQKSVFAHDDWQKRLHELAPATILSTRPVNDGHRRFNEGFVWEQGAGYRAAHRKFYLPDEDGCWEASWYHRGDGDFTPVESGSLRTGFLICTELWFMEQAWLYGKAGSHVIVTPRATERASLDKWLVGGRAAAVVAGAFSLSSNRANSEGKSQDFGGQGWIIGPDGQVLGLTSRQQPFVTREIDLSEAEQAKKTYPRYIS